QPYFAPYAGYFRLFAAADLFVVYDCVQFARRGWVHRNRLPGGDGKLRWLTLPLEHAGREVLIRDLRFRPEALAELTAEMRRFPSLELLYGKLRETLLGISGDVVGYLERLLAACCSDLGLPFETMRSSTLQLDPNLRGEARVIAIARAVGAQRYVNSPGGRVLYDHDKFAENGLELVFLPEFPYSAASILHRLATETARAIRSEIIASTTYAR
ncbi:MAG: WbqC family protein, partial [Betaproteobacteria bacterium]|nr:WbqC family protein [Betaproteobacteria bacterium]